MIIDWSKAPEGATHAVSYQATADSEFEWVWAKCTDGKITFHSMWDKDGIQTCYGMSDRAWDIVSARGSHPVVHEWPQIRPWNGEGLPPVGTVCEFQHRNAPNGVWHPTTIRYSSHAFVVFLDSIHDCEECWRVRDSCGIDFRPARTAEQIAAEKRKLAIWEMACDCGYGHNEDHGYEVSPIFEAAYDAGYRKLVQP